MERTLKNPGIDLKLEHDLEHVKVYNAKINVGHENDSSYFNCEVVYCPKEDYVWTSIDRIIELHHCMQSINSAVRNKNK